MNLRATSALTPSNLQYDIAQNKIGYDQFG